MPVNLFYLCDLRLICIVYIFYCSICGTLHSVDQYLNIKLTDISVTDPEKYPHMVSGHTQ